MNNSSNGRKSFAKIPVYSEMPDFLDVQLISFENFLQSKMSPSKRLDKGLENVFRNVFPISDTRGNYILEFVEYYIENPRYTEAECKERGVTYSVPLKAKLRLSSKDKESGEEGVYTDTIEQVVYLGYIPLMTKTGTFIINGAERIVVSQLHRSPGVFFDESKHPNGTSLYSARVIPFRGSWIEFATDINDIIYVYIDRRRRFPVTILLRALGYSTDEDLLELFDMIDVVKITGKQKVDSFGKKIFGDIVDVTTGEILVEKGAEINDEMLEKIKHLKLKTLKVVHESEYGTPQLISNTLVKDTTESQKAALEMIYLQFRSGDTPDAEAAKALIDRLFFNPKRYDLGEVGRYRMNRKLSLDIDESTTVLTREDIVAILKCLIELHSGRRSPDDIDHLGNRRVKTVGEQLAAQMNVAFSRMTRMIKERMNLRDQDKVTPQDLVNARTILSVINTFFGTSQLSQFMDQTNPLAELTHKRRLSALGPGGLTRERAGFEVRDVHYTHYGRLCPVETPEGPNIGLISSLTTYGRINDFGFVETPYLKVENGVISKNIEYLSADDEDRFVIAQANAPVDESGKFVNDRVKARFRGEFPIVPPEKVDYMDVSPTQMVSVAAALIPFLEHDDANRALMGSNMQRQGVPMLITDSPIVGTGIESKVARDSRTLLISEYDGKVEHLDATKIVIRKRQKKDGKLSLQQILDFDEEDTVTYYLKKFSRTNQDTMINQRPIVSLGQKVEKGDVLADGCATDNGELALGKNVLVAFMPWYGYNFEDAIVISERVVRDDVYTSIHIQEFDIEVRDTKRGEEEITREIPNVSEEAIKDLDENGIICNGAEVKADDILVGKVTPKGETEPTPEEKLLKAIFGDKAGDVKDASLKAPPGMKGVVVESRLFSRKKKDSKSKTREKKQLEEIDRKLLESEERLRNVRNKKLLSILDGKVSAGIRDEIDAKVLVRDGVSLTEKSLLKINFDRVNPSVPWTKDEKINELVTLIYEKFHSKLNGLYERAEREKLKIQIGDDLAPGIVQKVKVYVAKKRKLMVGDKMAGRHGNKGVVAKIVPIEDMPFLPDGTPVDIVLNPLGVPSRMNLGQILETILGWAGNELGIKYASPVFDGASIDEVKEELRRAGLPESGKIKLSDGRIGEPFDEEALVGYIYILKLSHLVEDKIHARSIGPYSLITQQPLGGKAQFGGQRFGEMEVWALEAYGAAHTLQEILTVKADDVKGRSRAYEAIVKGENLPEPGVPESFNVLLKELQGLGLDVELE
ncbi:DNA-directed RNA polymerase subunit beta [candidate division KSB1 bacterium]|nr:DNA-directed RNA polymerase subunit beta [candidate division KSB1 bacterium]